MFPCISCERCLAQRCCTLWFCKALRLCLESRSLCCGIIPVLLESFTFFTPYCVYNNNVLCSRTVMILHPLGREMNVYISEGLKLEDASVTGV